MPDLWYKNAVVYSLDVETFMDSDGDGVGDFTGLGKRLDYLSGLGVTCLWLLPFYPSPNKDNGYDISDYYNVGERFGTLGDLVAFTREARERGMHIIVDLVVNHTSDERPWFRAARKDRDSKYRDYYVWTDDPPTEPEQQVVFRGSRESVWEYDEEAGAYYRHRFYKHEPDLNISNPAVREEIFKIVGFWLELGVSGFRLDAAPYLTGKEGLDNPYSKDPHAFLRDMRDFLSARRGEAVFIAETDVEPEKLATYFGDGQEMQLLFNFLLNNYLFLGLAREEAGPLVRGLELLPSKPQAGQWANWVRNHDELDLERLSEAERRDVVEAFAPEEEMRIYGRGIRRRYPPMVEGDRRRMELAYSLLFALPGTPVVRYGEEIGMGDDLSLPGRNSVRAPMQWSDEENGGFSTAPPEKLARPAIGSGPYGYERVNVASQRRDPDSFLNWFERAIRTRKECPEFGWGEWETLETGDPAVLALRYEWRDGIVVAVHNFSGQAREASLDLSRKEAERLSELFGDRRSEPVAGDPPRARLDAYGYLWLRVGALR